MNKQKAIIFTSISLVVIILVAFILSIIGKIEISSRKQNLFKEKDGWKKVEEFSGGPQSEPWNEAASSQKKLPAEIKGEIVSHAETILIIDQSTGALEVPYDINETPIYKEGNGSKEKVDISNLKLGATVTVIMNEAGNRAAEIIVQ